MIGRCVRPAICRTIGSVNAPAAVESPIKMVGAVLATTSARSAGPSLVRVQAAGAAAGWA
jgi:hypothetical protein